AQPLKKSHPTFTNEPSPERRLRIGYVSPDFCQHVIGRNVLPLLRLHDANQAEVFCYANVRYPDDLTRTYQQIAHHWRDTLRLTNEELADRVRADQIDILVDLALHLGGGRLPAFACKPAPIQVTFAGYPGGTGLEAMDYRLTDPWLDPAGLHDDWYREKSI